MDVSANFVNREKELKQIDDAISTLQDQKRLLRTPIIEFCGVQGIGKSAILQQIEMMCIHKKLSYIREDAKQFTPETLNEVKPKLTKSEPVAILLDALDDAGSESLQAIEVALGALIENGKLFVVLVSRNVQKFENTRSVSRKITVRTLQPLKNSDCSLYIKKRNESLSLRIHQKIFEWTHGYPLAMKVMTDAILAEGLDPDLKYDQKVLLSIIVERVINQNLFAQLLTNPPELERFQTLFSILSVPRHFNLVIMQELIQLFAPDWELTSTLAYITLPGIINSVINVMSWDMQQSGYCIDISVRNIFLLKLSIEQPQTCTSIHFYLAEVNKRFAQAVSDDDSVRYVREYLYHLVKSEKVAEDMEVLTRELEALIKKESATQFLSFYEEFWQDEELREALGESTKEVMTFMRKRFIDLYTLLPQGEERFYLLLSFLARTLSPLTHEKEAALSKREKPFLILEPAIRQIMHEENAEVYVKFYAVLSQDQTLKEVLGEDFEHMLLLFAGGSSLGDR